MMLNSTLRSLTAGTAFLALTIWGLTSVMPNNTPAYALGPKHQLSNRWRCSHSTRPVG